MFKPDSFFVQDARDKTKEEVLQLETAYGILDGQGYSFLQGSEDDGDHLIFKKAELKEMIGRGYERLAKISGWHISNKESPTADTARKRFSSPFPTVSDTNLSTNHTTTHNSASWLGMAEYNELKNLPTYLRSAAQAYRDAWDAYYDVPCPSYAFSVHQRFLDCLVAS